VGCVPPRPVVTRHVSRPAPQHVAAVRPVVAAAPVRPARAESHHRGRAPSEPVAAVEPRYNLTPGRAVAVVREHEGQRRLDALQWGLIPFWA